MIRRTLLATAVLLATTAQAAELKTFEQKLGYAVGRDMAKGLQEKGLKVDVDALMTGFREQMAGKPSRLSDAELQKLARETQAKIIAHQIEQRKKLAAENAAEEKKFFAENGKKPGVKTLPEGIQYKVLKQGKGPSPKADDTVVVHYEGRLLNGKVFDSSYKRGKPIRLKMDQVIKGWRIVLPKMKVGDKWRVWIPAKLAYGERGAGDVIGPNAALRFDIELMNIEPKDGVKKGK